MLFKDLKIGYPIYVLDRNSVSIKQGKIKKVGLSRFDNKIGHTAEMVIDVDVEIDNETKPMTLPDSSESLFIGEYLFTTSKELVLHEIGNIKSQSEESLSKTDFYKETISKCDSIIAELNPEETEKKHTEERLNKIEDMLSNILKQLNK